MILQTLQTEVLISRNNKNKQGLNSQQQQRYKDLQQNRKKKFKQPKKFLTQFPQIKKDDSQYEFRIFHKVQNMRSAHFQSKYTLSMGSIPNLLLHTFSDHIVFYDAAKLKSQIASIPFEALGLDVSDNICAIAGMRGQILLINLLNGKMEKQIINQKRDFINHAYFYQNYLIANDNEGFLKIFDYQNGLQQVYSFQDKKSINLSCVNSNKQIAYCGDRLGLFVLDVQSNTIIHSLDPHSEFGFAVAFNPCKSYELASSSEDGSTVIYDLRSPKMPLQQFIGSDLPIYNITYQRNGSHLFMSEANSYFHILNTTLYDTVQSVQIYGEISGIANDTYDENRVYFSTSSLFGDGICEYSK